MCVCVREREREITNCYLVVSLVFLNYFFDSNSIPGMAEFLKMMLFSGRFAAQSKVFAVNMCSKISEMIRGYATPLR